MSLKDRKSSEKPSPSPGDGKHKKLHITRGRLRWLGDVERMDKDNWVKKCREIVV